MSKNINTAIAAIAFIAATGIAGALENEAIAFAPACVIIIACGAIALIAARAASRAARRENEVARRRAARLARAAAMNENENTARRARTIALARF